MLGVILQFFLSCIRRVLGLLDPYSSRRPSILSELHRSTVPLSPSSSTPVPSILSELHRCHCETVSRSNAVPFNSFWVASPLQSWATTQQDRVLQFFLSCIRTSKCFAPQLGHLPSILSELHPWHFHPGWRRQCAWAFNSFWVASRIPVGKLQTMTATAFNSFWVASVAVRFNDFESLVNLQFFLSCIRGVEKHVPRQELPFNSFWVASRARKGDWALKNKKNPSILSELHLYHWLNSWPGFPCVDLQFFLSCILRLSSSNGTPSNLTFNSFWVASLLTILGLTALATTFNSFWVASLTIRRQLAYLWKPSILSELHPGSLLYNLTLTFNTFNSFWVASEKGKIKGRGWPTRITFNSFWVASRNISRRCPGWRRSLQFFLSCIYMLDDVLRGFL